MARYVMANRRAGKFSSAEKAASSKAFSNALKQIKSSIDIVDQNAPDSETDRQVVVFEATPGEIEAKSVGMPSDVILEPEILHFPQLFYPADFVGIASTPQDALTPAGSGDSLSVRVRGGGSPLKGAEVILFLRGMGGLQNRLTEVTGANGKAEFSFSSFWEPSALIAVPAGDFWSVVVRGPEDGADIDCPPLPEDGPIDWWHTVLGAAPFDGDLGKGIRVGVADTGVGPHPCLAHVTDIGAFINGGLDAAGGADVDVHGSHVNGIVGARPQSAGQYAGLAPGAALFSARVFPPNSGANQGDIANAIDALSADHQVDLINLSLGAPTGSQIERDAIKDALERGTLCICAAANSAGPVEFPAAFPETVAVSALGLLGWGPAGTIASLRLPPEPGKFGAAGLYLSNFSCFGPEVDCCGPGVGIVSTVPARHGIKAPYAALDGTSMASPAVCGALAAILATNDVYKGLPRDQTRSSMARSVLKQRSRDIDIEEDFQGFGLPSLR